MYNVTIEDNVITLDNDLMEMLNNIDMRDDGVLLDILEIYVGSKRNDYVQTCHEESKETPGEICSST